MAVSLSQFSLSSPNLFSYKLHHPNIKSHTKFTHPINLHAPLKLTHRVNQKPSIIPKAIQQENENNSESTQNEKIIKNYDDNVASSELGEQIKKAMKERDEQQKGSPDFWSGVVEEIKEIDWPAFNKVLGITGVVMGVIAGSSVVLLTVNAILAEFSDTLFAGKGVQDFFS